MEEDSACASVGVNLPKKSHDGVNGLPYRWVARRGFVKVSSSCAVCPQNGHGGREAAPATFPEHIVKILKEAR